MRTQTFPAQTVISLLREKTVAQLDEILEAFGTASRRTVCRKLVAAGCRSSYSHCGRFYTLDELAAYDEHGLWSYQGIRFSRAGTLLATAADLVEQAPAGRFAEELGQIVQVEVRNTLGKLVRARRLAREKLDGRFLYCSPTPQRRERQVRTRRVPGGRATAATSRSSRPPAGCSACWTSASAGCMPGWNRSATGAVATAGSRPNSAWPPWPRGASSCWPGTTRRSGSASPGAGARRLEKKSLR